MEERDRRDEGGRDELRQNEGALGTEAGFLALPHLDYAAFFRPGRSLLAVMLSVAHRAPASMKPRLTAWLW